MTTADAFFTDTQRHVRFSAVGDEASGRIVNIRLVNFGGPDDSDVPELTLRQPDGTERTMLAGPTGLQHELARRMPNVGDTLHVTFTGTKALADGHTMKVFTVRVTKGDA